MNKGSRTLFEKVWDSHIVFEEKDNPSILYIDAHLIHEVTTPQAFTGLRERKLGVFRTKRTFATTDHNVPTKDQDKPIKDRMSSQQVQTLEKNCEDFGLELWGLGHPNQGIVHIIGPQLGITKPGMTIVCGDSHTSTHGAFGSIAFGIGTSEVEEVLATQCILQNKPKLMEIKINGPLGKGVVSKDIILYIISQIGTGGGIGYFVEYSGSTIDSLSMEARMTICNMSIEMGARGGIIAPDDKTFEYMKNRKFVPTGQMWDKAIEYWKSLKTDEGARFDKVIKIDASKIEPMVTYGTNPGMGIKISENIPMIDDFATETDRNMFQKAIAYMGLKPGQMLKGHKIDYVFIGSCTNSRIEDLRLVAEVVNGKKKADWVNVLVVPGSASVRNQAIEEGLDKIFEEAGFEFRGAGCSACLGMNEDKVPSEQYCISTSNRNFEGRQGPGARTMLASPLTAAATAISGYVSDIREII